MGLVAKLTMCGLFLVVTPSALAGDCDGSIGSQPCDWSLVASSGPSPRMAPMINNFGNNTVLLYGGYYWDGEHHWLNQSWVWNGTSWTMFVNSQVGPRGSHAMAPWRATNLPNSPYVIVLFGGYSGNAYMSDTWRWFNNTWGLIPASGPVPMGRATHSMAYDSARNTIVLFGGVTFADGQPLYLGDTWEFNGQWTLKSTTGPQARFSPRLVYDEARQRTILFGGANPFFPSGFPETWEWNGESWSVVAETGPGPRSSHMMAYDPVQERVVLYGGEDVNEIFGDTWEWDGESWTLVSCEEPGPRYTFANSMAFDAISGKMLHFGGAFRNITFTTTTWKKDFCLPPSNDTCSNASVVVQGETSIATYGALTNGPTIPSGCGFTQIENDLWFLFPAQCDGVVTASLCGADFDSRIVIYGPPCPSAQAVPITCGDNECGDDAVVSFPVTAGQIFRLRVGAANDQVGTATLSITCGLPCTADLNGSGAVDVDDLLAVINGWGACDAPCPPACAADINDSCSVDVDDLLQVINGWGQCP